MPREQIPVTSSVITWARKRAGFSVEEAAEKFSKIAAWEAGEAFPTYPQIERLADTFKLPIAVFFFPEPPDLPPISESFRTLPAEEFEQIPRRVKFLLRKAQAQQLNLSELCQGQNPAERLITRDLEFTVNVQLEEMAREVRDYIGISLEEQYAWGTNDDAFKNWRLALSDVGVFVFKDAFRVPEYSGFCLYDEVFPIIYVNNSAAKTRQIFTLFHELAHLLFHTSGIDTIGDKYIPALPALARRIEVLCNRFAAQFLVPEAAFRDAIAGLDRSEATAELLAARFHVSREFIYRKFLDQGKISQEAYFEAADRWAKQRVSGGSGGDPYWTKIAYLGREYIQLALSQYHQNRIDQRQLAEYLNSKPRHVATLEEYFSRGGHMTYVFDNSPLSTLFRNYYRRRFPTLWQNFDDLVDNGDIVSTCEVRHEIEDGPDESLRDWAVQNSELFTVPNAEEGAFVAQIYAVRHFQQNIERQKMLKGGRIADPSS